MTAAGQGMAEAPGAPPARHTGSRPAAWRMPVFALGSILMLWVVIGLSIRADHGAATGTALRDAANLARTLEAQIIGRIDAIDATLRFAQALHARDPEGFRFGPWAGVDPAGDVPLGLVIGIDGFARIGPEGPMHDGIDRSDRGYMRAHLDAPGEDRLHIGPPIEGRMAQRRILVFSRPLHRDGTLAGVVALGIDPATFYRPHRDLDIGQGVIGLVGTDGVVRAWAPNAEDVVGTRLPTEPLAPLIDGHAIQLSRRIDSHVDGVDRLVVLRRIAGHPLIVSVGLPAEAMLAQFRADRTRHVVLGALLTLLIGLACGAVLQKRRAAGRARTALEAAIGHISQGVMMVGPDGRVAVVNARAVELLGLPPGLAVPGRRMLDIVAWQQSVGEFGDAPAPETIYRSLASAPGTPPDTHERTRPNGTVLEIRTEHLPDGSHVRTYTDLTAPRRAAQTIAEARDRALAAEAALAAVVENVPHGVLMVDAENRVVVMTCRARGMLDLPEELARPGTDVRALHRFQVARGDLDDAPVISETAGMALAERPAVIPTYERVLRNGRAMEVRTTLLPDGRAVRTYTDVTERHAAARAQEVARLAAERNVRARTEFLAMVSHELRTPLNAVIGLSGLLLDQGLPEAQAQQIRLIREAGDHLLALVNDILDVTRLERGQLPLQEEPFDPARTIRATVELMAPQAEAKGLSLSLDVAAGLPHLLVGDAARLRQVLLNLLGNAVKFTDAGSVAVTLAVLDETAEAVRLGLSVRDTGIGIAPDIQARLFDVLMQGEGGPARRFGGAGLGLAICRMLLERMGGGITVESAPGLGSTFRCEIPLRRAAPELAAPMTGEARSLRVLVAEDLPTNRLLITRMLKRLGHVVEAVTNGAEAVAAVKTAPYDLVLMDVMMPVMDGLAAARAIRALPAPAGRVPVIALTAHGSPEAEAECRASGINRFESKPIGPDALRAAIAAVVGAPAAA